MGNFIDIEKNVEPETTLFEQEIDAILGVLECSCQRLEKSPHCGTIILDGQKYGEAAKCILKAHFQGGIYRRQFFRLMDRTSDDMAADSINEVLAWPEEASRFEHKFVESFCEFVGQKVPDTGIYQDGELVVLNLNATHGRFLCSIKAESAEGEELLDEAKWLLNVVAEAFAHLGKEDATLQSSVNRLFTGPYRNFGILCATGEVNVLFDACEIAPLQAWHAWHEPANNSGELTLFFQ